ncbi:MAG: RES family NAD+ phosphorylase [SAR324 cluster bacterium]|nr:RES family NAD+ phosphorylase [SAR324 cluster bacterium]
MVRRKKLDSLGLKESKNLEKDASSTKIETNSSRLTTFKISGKVESVIQGQETGEQLRKYFWEEYSALTSQRAEIFDDLKTSLLIKTRPFEFSHYQRILKTKYLDTPLSAMGSVRDPTGGGRFNIGDIDPSRFPPFPALYLASDKKTARLEFFGPIISGGSLSDRYEQALSLPESIAEFSISGKIEEVLDISKSSNLKPYFDHIKHFTYPEHLHILGDEIGLERRSIATSPSNLLNSIMGFYWKEFPTLFSVPSNSQILGQIAWLAGIEAILYKSIRGTGRCLAIFSQNFINSPSFIELDDATPPGINLINRLDKSSWESLI